MPSGGTGEIGEKQPISEVDIFRHFMKVITSHHTESMRMTEVLPVGKIGLGLIAPLGLPRPSHLGTHTDSGPAPHIEQPHLPLSPVSKSPELSCLL